MIVSFRDRTMSKAERVSVMYNLIHEYKATIFSRLDSHEECVAIVPSAIRDTNEFYWVWLSSKEDGAFTTGKAIHKMNIAETLENGEWVHQPDAMMVLASSRHVE